MSSPYSRNPGLFKQMAEWVLETIKARAPEKKVADKLVDIARKKRSVGLVGEVGFPEEITVDGESVGGIYHPFEKHLLPQLRDPVTRRKRDIETFTFPEILDALAASRYGVREGIQLVPNLPDKMARTFEHELIHLGQNINPKGVLSGSYDLIYPFYRLKIPYDQRLEEYLVNLRLNRNSVIGKNPTKDLVSWYIRSKAAPLVRLQIENLAEINPELKKALAPYRSSKTERNVNWDLKGS